MFKAKLIERSDFYQKRRYLFVLSMVSSIFTALLINLSRLNMLIQIIAVTGFIVLNYYRYRRLKDMASIIADKEIRIDEQRILIYSKSDHKQSEINLGQVSKILIPSKYSMDLESVEDITYTLKGRDKRNYIEVSEGDKTQLFEFIIDSYYMQNLIEKLVDSWRAKSFNVVRI